MLAGSGLTYTNSTFSVTSARQFRGDRQCPGHAKRRQPRLVHLDGHAVHVHWQSLRPAGLVHGAAGDDAGKRADERHPLGDRHFDRQRRHLHRLRQHGQALHLRVGIDTAGSFDFFVNDLSVTAGQTVAVTGTIIIGGGGSGAGDLCAVPRRSSLRSASWHVGARAESSSMLLGKRTSVRFFIGWARRWPSRTIGADAGQPLSRSRCDSVRAWLRACSSRASSAERTPRSRATPALRRSSTRRCR